MIAKPEEILHYGGQQFNLNTCCILIWTQMCLLQIMLNFQACITTFYRSGGEVMCTKAVLCYRNHQNGR